MNLADFNYDLPPHLIAQQPLEKRDASRMMVVERSSGRTAHRAFGDLPGYLRAGDVLVANNSRVIPARLLGRKATGGRVELLLLKQLEGTRWEVLVGGKRIRAGTEIQVQNPKSKIQNLTAVVVEESGEGRRVVEFSEPLETHLPQIGQAPLPPYIRQTLNDAERYQTVYARHDGSVAAPTAGLHFTPEMLLALREKGVLLEYVTLHIGLDTFKPVTVEQIENHAIHSEWVRLSPESARRINEAKLHRSGMEGGGNRLVAVGTTAVRALETAALRSAGINGSLRQASRLAPGLCPWRTVAAIEEATDLFIYPGFEFRAVDALLTNFHLPRSTLLMLVSAFAGRDLILRAYEEAIQAEYRFYSFGDAMLIL
ncbi:MAG: tRNA preQ1(34) S-adenosylmethionine ribosyltransferase-isomerase QueA [Anaerolineae bacterium]